MPPSPGIVASRYLWYVTVAVVSGIGSGLLIAGAGGRLAMRLLAATAGDAAQAGRPRRKRSSVASPLRWLLPGRLGGLAYGLVLLIVAAPRINPCGPTNPDFGIVGRG